MLHASAFMANADWVSWVVIGAAASLAGMIWPFLRGTRGVLSNMLLGASGGIVGGAVVAVGSSSHGRSPMCLAGAAVGSVVGLTVGHLLWRGWRSGRMHRRAP
jgi:uncharacterized membrane protein YeaQ/YmgE (transglycosylase-associated protein family)